MGFLANVSSSEDSDDDTNTVVCDDDDSVRNGEIVQITHVDDDAVYVRPVKYDDRFDDMMKQINATTPHPVHMPIRENDIVLVKFCDDYARAIVLDATAQFEVQLIDFGNKKVVTECSDLKRIPSQLKAERRMVLPVKIKLPEILSANEKSAVDEFLHKWIFNMFIIRTESSIVELHSTVDFVHIVSGMSLTHECVESCIEKKLTAEAITKKRVSKQNASLFIVDTENRPNDFICCILQEDMQLFGQRFQDLSTLGRELIDQEPYLPDKFELCFVIYQNEWYRGQFHQRLENERAQIGLIDFGTSVVVSLRAIRKFQREYAYECVSLVCKMRNRQIDMSLLNENLIQNYTIIDVHSIQPSGDFHELKLPNDYFIVEEDFI